MQTIKKFQIGQRYYPSEKYVMLQVLERNGKELKVARLHSDGSRVVFTATTSFAANEKGAFEYFTYNFMRVPATNHVPEARRVSELPPEEQKIINDAIMRDVEYRKKKKLSSANILTEHSLGADGKVSITHSTLKD